MAVAARAPHSTTIVRLTMPDHDSNYPKDCSSSIGEQLCAAAVIQNAVAWIGASSDASGEWSWITGETWSYEVWATPASSVAPWWAAATSANALVGWAGHNAMANRSVNGHWYPCGSGCPRPRSVLVEYESTDTYTCVGCPWGHAGTYFQPRPHVGTLKPCSPSWGGGGEA